MKYRLVSIDNYEEPFKNTYRSDFTNMLLTIERIPSWWAQCFLFQRRTRFQVFKLEATIHSGDWINIHTGNRATGDLLYFLKHAVHEIFDVHLSLQKKKEEKKEEEKQKALLESTRFDNLQT